jgi:hypothetical protein
MAVVALCTRTVLYSAFSKWITPGSRGCNLLLQSGGKKYHLHIPEEPCVCWVCWVFACKK